MHEKIAKYNEESSSNCPQKNTSPYAIGDYHILRYRDDYRIFTHTREDASRIAKLLTEVLADLNFKLNQQKTFVTNHIIRDAIKPDKYIRMQSIESDNNLQRHLMLIQIFSEKHSNSGSLKVMLQRFFERPNSDSLVADTTDGDVLLALLVDIIYHNPTTYPIAIPIAGRLAQLGYFSTEYAFGVIKRKMQHLPYTEFLDIWQQRLTIKSKPCEEYKATICKVVANTVVNRPVRSKEQMSLWNNEWLKSEFRKIIEETPIVNKTKIEEMPEVPTAEETNVFCNQY